MANTVKTTFQADTKPQDKAVAKLQADLARYKQQRERDEQKLTRHIEQQAEARSRAEIRAYQKTLREIDRLRREDAQRARQIAGYTKTGATYIAGGAIAGGYLAQQAIDKAIEQSRANRLLASAATEAGVAQSKLAEANRKFAESVGLSNVAAATTTSQIQRLATYAGRPGQVEQLLKAFADLGAARGIGGSDLETLIGTILSGQDEGLNRLGISDPGQLQKAYAAALGKTTEELTQQEKVQAAVNAVLEKSAVFAGAAEARMNSLEGQVVKSTAAWENFTNALATTLTTSGPVTDFINEASKAIGGLSIQIDQVNQKLREGKTPKQIADELYPGPSTGDYISAGATALTFGAAGIFLSPTIAAASSPTAIAARRRAQLEQQIAAQAQSNKQQELAAYHQRAEASRKTYQDVLDQDVERVFGPEAVKKAKKDQEEALEKQKKAADELKKKLEELKQAKYSLFDSATSGSENPFINFLGNANREMRSLLETAKNLSPALQAAFIARARDGNTQDLIGLRVSTRLGALSLREQAREFRQGYRNDLSDPKTVQAILDRQLFQLKYTPGGPNQALTDQTIIGLAGNLDPKLLRQNQRTAVASAFESEARRRLTAEKEALNFYQQMTKLINGEGLKVRIDDGSHLVRVINEAPNSARVDRRPSRADSATHYGN